MVYWHPDYTYLAIIMRTPWRTFISVSPTRQFRLDFTFQNGQMFSWRAVDRTTWRGVIDRYVVSLKQLESEVKYVCHNSDEDITPTLHDYFQTHVDMNRLHASWSATDNRTAVIVKALDGMRIVRQDPTECLFSFICSSNNNISRITQILHKLRSKYGVHLGDFDGESFYSFPTVDNLAEASEQDLRDLGLGYRARFIRESALKTKSLGPSWLPSLRRCGAEETQSQLLQLPGVGRKVADCVALFSLDQTEVVPVDTHVWAIACRDLDPTLKASRSLTPAVYARVGQLFLDRYGGYAGWAHSFLFAAELPLFSALLPAVMQGEMKAFREEEKQGRKQAKKQKQEERRKEEGGDDSAGGGVSGAEGGGRGRGKGENGTKGPTATKPRKRGASSRRVDEEQVIEAEAKSTTGRRGTTKRSGAVGKTKQEGEERPTRKRRQAKRQADDRAVLAASVAVAGARPRDVVKKEEEDASSNTSGDGVKQEVAAVSAALATDGEESQLRPKMRTRSGSSRRSTISSKQ